MHTASETGWTIEEFEQASPPMPNRAELIEGIIHPKSPQRSWHSYVVRQLANALEDTSPEQWVVLTEIGIRIGKRTRPEPDIVVIDRAALDSNAASYQPDKVHLAIEVVSPESAERDYTDKPALYASAGIPHYWCVKENETGEAVVYIYELDPVAGRYFPQGMHHKLLTMNAPWRAEIDLTQVAW